MWGTDVGLRVKTRSGRGGAISGITMRRVRMNGVLTALSANTYYHCDADGHDDWAQAREPAAVGDGTPQIDGITVEGVDIYRLAHAAGVFPGLPDAPISNVRIRELRVQTMKRNAVPAQSILADGVRDLVD